MADTPPITALRTHLLTSDPPAASDAYNNLGVALAEHSGRAREAAAAYVHAIRLAPAHAVAYNNLAALLASSPQTRSKALDFYLVAHALQPEQYERFPQMHLNLAAVLVDAARYDESNWHYRRGLRYEPNAEDTLGRLVHLSQRTCDWRSVRELWPRVHHALERVRRRRHQQPARPAFSPMHALTLPLSAASLLGLAAAHAEAIEADVGARHARFEHSRGALLPSGSPRGRSAASVGPHDHGRRHGRRRLHVGFLSYDFKRHPVTVLMAPALLALRKHCPSLRLTLFALNPMTNPMTNPMATPAKAAAAAISAPTASPLSAEADEAVWGARLRAAAHRIVPLHNVSDEDAARLIHADRLDALIDLNGLYSRGARVCT